MNLLDTNVVSELRKPDCDAGVAAWYATVHSEDLYISVLVVGEIRLGIERLRRREPFQAAVYERWLSELQRDFAERIVPISAEIADEWGRMNVSDPVPAIDGLMAATAKLHGWTFVTRDVYDVAGTGVRLLNPFEFR